MTKSMGRKILISAFISLAILGIGYGVAILIANRYGLKLTDALFIEGMAVLAVGLLLSMKGNPSGASLQGLGRNNAPQISNLQAETTQTERELTGYYKNFRKQSVIEFSAVNLTITAGGS